MSKKDKVFFPNLDGFRFLSFLLVFLSHGFIDVVNNHQEGGFIATTLRIAFFNSGQLGVSFFFVLSGFLITYLILAEVEEFGKLDLKAFYIRRGLRIFPLYFGLVIFIFVFLPLFTSVQLPNPLYYFFFLSNFDLILNSNGSHMSDVTWSVSVEEQFYLFWALLFYFIKPKHYVYVFPILIVGSAIFRSAHSDNQQVIYFHTLSVVSELAIGGLTAYLLKTSARFTRFFEELPKSVIAVSYLLIITLLLFNRFLFIYSTLGRIILGVAIAFVITEQNYSKNSFYKMGNYKILSELGKFTYGLYLLHPIIIHFVISFAQQRNWDTASIPTGAALGITSLVISIFVCYLSYVYFESPFLRLKKRFAHIQTAQTGFATDYVSETKS